MTDRKPKTRKPDDIGTKRRKSGDPPLPAAGPHAKPELTNPDATPGAGTLPDADEGDMGGVSS